MAAVELVRDKATKERFQPELGVGAFAAERGLAHGVMFRAIGDTLAFCPPLIIAKDEIDQMFAAFGRALDDTETKIRKKI